jgi:hypothetical protein
MGEGLRRCLVVAVRVGVMMGAAWQLEMMPRALEWRLSREEKEEMGQSGTL